MGGALVMFFFFCLSSMHCGCLFVNVTVTVFNLDFLSTRCTV